MKTRGEHHRSPDWDPRSFYERQEEWSGAYTGPITDYHRRKAALVARHCGRERRVLELGAGGGQAALATAELGLTVDAVELVPRLAAYARTLAASLPVGCVNVIEDDFYTGAVTGPYGAVAYWDGFGIGTDIEQQTLLRKIRAWLADDGRALIDIYTPWYWEAVAGATTKVGTACRRYDFDVRTQRMIDTWWAESDPRQAKSQMLRCYAPEELELLIEPTGLTVEETIVGGAYDYERAVYRERAVIGEAMSYTVVAARTP